MDPVVRRWVPALGAQARGMLIVGGLILLWVSSIYFVGGSLVGAVLGSVIFAGGILMLALGAISVKPRP